MKLIYVAGPYTGKSYSEIDDNIMKAEDVSIMLFTKGWNVFTPHKNTSHYERYEGVAGLDYHTWIETTKDMLRRCDAIIMMKEWERSSGSKDELEFATAMKIPIYYEKDGLPNASDLEQT